MKIQLLFTLLFLTSIANGQDTLSHQVLFNIDKDNIKASEESKLLNFLDKIKDRKINAVYLSGHTDSDGSNEYNEDLSRRRVNNVKLLLESKISAVVNFSAHGEEKPLNDNSTLKDKELNRRVEILLILEKVKPIATFDLFRELSVPEQEFCIDQRRDTTLVLEQGTTVEIYANTFISNDPCVKLTAKEVYTIADMIGEQLSTISNGRQLETGGMIYLEVSDDLGKELEAQKELNILMPTDEFKNDMQLFYGEEDPHHGLNWQLAHGDSLGNNLMTGVSTGIFKGLIPPPIGDEEECKLFFCKIKTALSGVGIGEWRFPIYPVYSDSLQQLMDSLGVNNYEELRAKMIEQSFENGDIGASSFSYYAFSTSKLGWMNCDRFTNRRPLISMDTGIKFDSGVVTNLVFKKFKSVMQPNDTRISFKFDGIKENEPVYYVAMKQDNNEILLSIIETKVSAMAPELKFEAVSIKELKNRLAKLN